MIFVGGGGNIATASALPLSFLLRPAAASCRILCSNVRGLSGNLSDLAVASAQYDILLCSETFVSDLRHVRVAGSWVRSPCLVVPGQAASCLWDGGICTRWIWSISPTKI